MHKPELAVPQLLHVGGDVGRDIGRHEVVGVGGVAQVHGIDVLHGYGKVAVLERAFVGEEKHSRPLGAWELGLQVAYLALRLGRHCQLIYRRQFYEGRQRLFLPPRG